MRAIDVIATPVRFARVLLRRNDKKMMIFFNWVSFSAEVN
jgi:hypothetical protein